jgi:signal transduction histidine kinase
MLVKTRLQIIIAVSVLMALIIVLVLYWGLYRVNRAVQESDLAGEIIISAFERNAFRSDYLQTDSERAKKQWLAKHEQMAGLLKSASKKFTAPEDRKVLEEMIKDHQVTGKIFSDIVRNRETAKPDPDSAALSQEVESRLASQLQRRLYDRVLNARRLYEAAGRHLFADLRLAGGAIMCVIALVTIAAVLNTWIMGRTIADRFARLRNGASLVGAGNLEHRIGIEGGDEFAELSQAFDAMTLKLRSSYLKLEDEITERKSAEEGLRQSEDRFRKLNEELEMRVSQRTAELEESRVELEAQNAQLQDAYHQLELETAQRIRIVEELRQKEQLLIQQSRQAAMGEMLGNIAHQWRQPLNVLGLMVQELGLSYQLGRFSEELLDDNIDKAMEIIQHMSQTIDSFRDFLAPEQEKKPFQVAQVIAKTVGLIKETFKLQNIAVEVITSGEPQITGFANEYSQVLLNLLTNARDAFHEHRVPDARITVRSWVENGRTVVTVTDNAGGIKEEILGKIFDAYFTTKELGKGSGVGLFMSKNIIEKNMGGRLTVRNVEDGAQFKIEV